MQRRLRALKWPEPPPGARERGLESLRSHLEQLSEPDSKRSSEPDSNGDMPEPDE